jgi:hypothetical protein
MGIVYSIREGASERVTSNPEVIHTDGSALAIPNFSNPYFQRLTVTAELIGRP